MQLREYQIPFVDSIRDAFRSHQRVLGQLPTGGGKTPCASFIISKIAATGKQVWFVAHKSFLVQQASDKLRIAGVRHGIIAPGHHPDSRHNVLVCSLGALRNRMDRVRVPDWVVLDEAHHASATTWAELFDRFPKARFLGLTATPERPDGTGLDKYFDTIVSGPSMAEMIEWGKTHPGEGLCDFSIVADASHDYTAARHNSKGEFDLNTIGEMMVEKKIMGDAVEQYRKHANGRQFLTFAPTIAVSERVAEAYCRAGFKVIHLDGTSGRPAINAALRAFERRDIVGITSVNLFLEGLDVKGVSVIQCLRPTESIVVYLQSLGRGLRSESGKHDCLILDHVGNTAKHGLPDQHREWSLEGKRARLAKEKPVPLWDCPKCRTSNQFAYSRCKACDTPRPVKARKEIEVDASVNLEALDLDLIREQASRNRQEQSSARGVEALIAIGKSVGQARHIEAARLEKAYMRAQVREKAAGLGDFDMLREYMRLKPKALKTYLEQTQ